MSIKQSNTRAGMLPLIALASLVGKEGFLVEVVNTAGVANVQVPNALTDLALYVVEAGSAAGAFSDVIPLEPGRNMRAVAKGAILPGAVLILADPATAADQGKVRSIIATAGTYFSPGIAEEVAADGGLVRFRPFPRLVVVV